MWSTNPIIASPIFLSHRHRIILGVSYQLTDLYHYHPHPPPVASRLGEGSRGYQPTEPWHQLPLSRSDIKLKLLSPKITFITIDAVFFKQCSELILKTHFYMVLTLMFNVFDYRGYDRLANSEYRITILPGKFTEFRN